MRAICLLDTSVFAEFLGVFGQTTDRHEQIITDLHAKIDADEALFLPMATIFETGNHIGQIADGGRGHACARKFALQVSMALEGQSPFNPVRFADAPELLGWVEAFPDMAKRGIGFGDLSIIEDWKWMCRLNNGRRVYVWSLDRHLDSYDREPGVE